MYILLTDTLPTRQQLFDIYPVQNLLDIARNRTDAVDERSYMLHSGDQVSLRGHEDDVWFSYLVPETYCVSRGCPGRDRPFISQSDTLDDLDCGGEVFYIYAENRAHGDRIQSGDTIALMSSSITDKYYYVSCHDPGFWSLFNRDAVQTVTSPRSTYGDRNPNIPWRSGENFRITTYNTATMYIEDRQVIQFKNEARRRYLNFGTFNLIRCSDYTGKNSRFQIFRRFSPFAVASHQYQP